MSDWTALVVDDDAVVRGTTARLVRSMGLKAVEARSGGEAIGVARSIPTRIDILVTDVGLPDVSGHEVARRLREVWPGLPVLLVSGYPWEGNTPAAHGEATEFLEKPFTLHSLREKISALLAPR